MALPLLGRSGLELECKVKENVGNWLNKITTLIEKKGFGVEYEGKECCFHVML